MISRHRKLFAVIIVVYALVVVLVAFWPTHIDQGFSAPIDNFIEWSHQHGMPWMRYTVIEKGANVLYFMPLGALITLELGRDRWWLASLIGFGVSGSIEAAQLVLPGRTASILDVIANGMGATIGAFLTFLVLVIIRRGKRVPRAAQTERVAA